MQFNTKAMIPLVLALVIAQLSLIPASHASGCTYYVDSVSGSDSNTGTSSEAPFQHLAAIPVLTDGSTVCLRRGSTFTDSLFIGIPGAPVNNVTVEDYGPSNLPIPMIDNSNSIPASAWTPVGGSYPNLYQATVTGPGTGQSTPYGTEAGLSGTDYINAFECKVSPCSPTGAGGNDNFLATYTAESDANANAGSYYIPGQNASNRTVPNNPSTLTIYVHASDSSNPATNGYTYSYSARFAGLEMDGANETVINIATKKGADNNGNFDISGENSTITGVESDQGGKHNLFCQGGCVLINSLIVDQYYPVGGMVVVFDGSGTGKTATMNNDIFLNGVTTAGDGGESASAFVSHNGDGTSLDSLTFNGGLVEAVNGTHMGGVGGGANTNVMHGVTCINASPCIEPDVNSSTTTINNTQASGTDSVFFDMNAASSDLYISSSLMCGGPVPVRNYQFNNDNIDVTGSTIYLDSSNGFPKAAIVVGNSTGGSIVLNNTIVNSPVQYGTWIYSENALSSTPYTGDNNAFVLPNTSQGIINGTTYHGLAAWQTATGQDAHTVTTGDASDACVLPAFGITGPSTGYVNAASSNFTVTPNKPYTGTVTLTPMGTAGAGLGPVTLTFNNSTTAQTFSVTPTAPGTLSMVPFVNGSTSSPTFLPPQTLSYTANVAVPSVPTALTVLPYTDHAVLSWTAPASTGGSAITDYTVQDRPTGSNVAWTAATHTPSTATSQTVTGLISGQSYDFEVAAANSAGTGAFSSPITASLPTGSVSTGSGGGGGGTGGGGQNSPSGTATIPTTPTGPIAHVSSALVNDNGTFYLISGTSKMGITNPGILASYGYTFSQAAPASSAQSAQAVTSNLPPNNGALVKTSSDPTVYLISGNQRYGFSSANVFTSLGYKFSSVLVVTTPELDQLPVTTPLMDPTKAHLAGTNILWNGTVYWIGSDNELHAYPSLTVYNSWNIPNDFSGVVPANAADEALTVGSVEAPRS